MHYKTVSSLQSNWDILICIVISPISLCWWVKMCSKLKEREINNFSIWISRFYMFLTNTSKFLAFYQQILFVNYKICWFPSEFPKFASNFPKIFFPSPLSKTLSWRVQQTLHNEETIESFSNLQVVQLLKCQTTLTSYQRKTN